MNVFVVYDRGLQDRKVALEEVRVDIFYCVSLKLGQKEGVYSRKSTLKPNSQILDGLANELSKYLHDNLGEVGILIKQLATRSEDIEDYIHEVDILFDGNIWERTVFADSKRISDDTHAGSKISNGAELLPLNNVVFDDAGGNGKSKGWNFEEDFSELFLVGPFKMVEAVKKCFDLNQWNIAVGLGLSSPVLIVLTLYSRNYSH